MMSDSSKRIELLLIDEATGNLTDAGRAELDALLKEHPEVDSFAYERVAAAIFLSAATEKAEPMPDSLKSKLSTAADELFQAND